MRYYHRVILEILKEKGVMRYADLVRAVNERLESEGYEPVSWQSFYIKPLVDGGFVAKWKPGHMAYYAITEKGYEECLSPKQRKRRGYRRLEKVAEYIVDALLYQDGISRSNELWEELLSAAKQCQRTPQEAVDAVLRNFANKLTNHGRLDLLNWLAQGGFDSPDSWKKIEIYQTRKRWRELVREHYWATGEKITVAELKRRCGGVLPTQLRREQVGKPKPLGSCVFCGALVHREEAVRSAEILKEMTGSETAVVCCGCYNHLMWVEKYLKLPKGGDVVE